ARPLPRAPCPRTLRLRGRRVRPRSRRPPARATGEALVRGSVEPSAREARPLQPLHDVRILAHRSPDELRPVVFDHRDDRALVDPEIVDVDPADAFPDPAV